MSEKQTALEMTPKGDSFREKITPKVPDLEKIFFFECSKCGGVHFRHAGYLETLTPMVLPDEKYVSKNDAQVRVCVKCRSAFVWVNGQVYDVTGLIDLKAWQKFEKEAHEATGPGGEC